MKKLSSEEKEIINFLNSKRGNAYIDIYLENDFSGLGILIDESLNIYKYEWKTLFGRQNNFSINNELYQIKKKITYRDIEDYLLKELDIVENEYPDDSNDEYRSLEIIRLKNYEAEFNSGELFEIIRTKINDLLKEEL